MSGRQSAKVLLQRMSYVTVVYDTTRRADLGEVPALDKVASDIPGSFAVNTCRKVTPRHARHLSAVNVV